MNDAVCFIGSVREWVPTEILHRHSDDRLQFESIKLEAPDQECREGRSDTVLKLTTDRTRITG